MATVGVERQEPPHVDGRFTLRMTPGGQVQVELLVDPAAVSEVLRAMGLCAGVDRAPKPPRPVAAASRRREKVAAGDRRAGETSPEPRVRRPRAKQRPKGWWANAAAVIASFVG